LQIQVGCFLRLRSLPAPRRKGSPPQAQRPTPSHSAAPGRAISARAAPAAQRDGADRARIARQARPAARPCGAGRGHITSHRSPSSAPQRPTRVSSRLRGAPQRPARASSRLRGAPQHRSSGNRPVSPAGRGHPCFVRYSGNGFMLCAHGFRSRAPPATHARKALSG
jgi:hypothetical protein